MELPCDLAQMNADQLRDLTASLIAQVTQKDRELRFKQLKIEQLTHEMATLKRWRFARRSEQLNAVQRSLLEESIDEDLEAIGLALKELQSSPKAAPPPKEKPRRVALPADLPRIEFHHEPDETVCSCGCALERFDQDVSEKLDYIPGVFQVHRHIRGKWVCRRCEKLIQAPVPAQVIDKGIPTAGLLAQVLVAKYADHQPLYRQEGIFERAGLAIARSTLAQWVGACGVRLEPLALALKAALLAQEILHADETPVPMLKPGLGRTHRAYLWSYSSTQYNPMAAVVYDFADSRSGQHARTFLGGWSGKLICDDYSGYKALFARGVVEVGCMAHARRKFHEVHENHRSQIAAEALVFFGALYDVETRADEQKLDAICRQNLRRQRAKPIADSLREWLILHRQKVPDGSATAKAIRYTLDRWKALVRYLDDGDLPIDNNWVENRIRPVALGRSNWLFAGSLRAGRRAAVIMSLIQSAKLNGHDPYRYLKDVLERLPTQPASRIEDLLPHHWYPLQQTH
ncbi:MAG: transposase [Rhodospirillales bacterium]|jgi:transposase|nr:transposase [Rhodospirillales bacterium]